MADCHFRARLDDPSGWDCWTLAPDELARLHETQRAAGHAAAGRLHDHFGRTAAQFGATDLAQSIGALEVDAQAAFSLARALVAVDCFDARARPPRPKPGGMTTARNRRVWARLRTHMLARLDAALAVEAAATIHAQCVFARVPADRVPTVPFERSLAGSLAGTPGYKTVAVALDVDQEPQGGLVWLAAQSSHALETVREALAARRPCVLELLRDAGTAPGAAELVVAFALDGTPDGAELARLRVWDPAAAADRRLDVATERGGALRLIERNGLGEPPDDDARPTVKALRVWQVAPARPPLLGLRRILPWHPPWRAAWWLKRRFVVYVLERLDRRRHEGGGR